MASEYLTFNEMTLEATINVIPDLGPGPYFYGPDNGVSVEQYIPFPAKGNSSPLVKDFATGYGDFVSSFSSAVTAMNTEVAGAKAGVQQMLNTYAASEGDNIDNIFGIKLPSEPSSFGSAAVPKLAEPPAEDNPCENDPAC